MLKIKSQLKHLRKRGRRSSIVLTKNREGRDIFSHTKVNQNRNCNLKVCPLDFPDSPVVKTSPSNAGHVGSIPDQAAKITHASWPKNQNIKNKQKTEAIM